MLRRIIALVTFLSCGLTAATGFIGCVNDSYDIEHPSKDAELVLEISGLRTRASSGADFSEAEKLVRSIDLFFYPSDANDGTAATLHIRTGVTMNTDVETSNQGKIRVNVKPEDVFLNGADRCRVYAAVNSSETENKEKITLGELKNLKIKSSDWVITDNLDENGDLSDFEGFAMFTVNPAGDEVRLETVNGEPKISGLLIVDKLMSKIDLFLGFGASDTVTDIESWSITAPDPNEAGSAAKEWRVYRPLDADKKEGDTSVFGDAAEVYIVNGVKAARLGGCFGADGSLLTDLSDEDYFDLWAEDTESENDFMNYAHKLWDNPSSESGGKYPYFTKSSFYTYPNSWTDGVLNNNTYLILKVNWIPTESANVEEELLETYYKVPLNKSDNNILSNKHYTVKVKINTLGGLHFGAPVLLDDCTYEVIPWNRMELDAKLRETRYLEVRQDVVDRDGTHYTGIMNNSAVITIPFYSSHKVEIREATVTYYDFLYAVKGATEDEVRPTDRIVSITTPEEVAAFTLSEDQLDTDTPGVFIDEINSRIIIQHLFHPIKRDGDHYVHVTENEGRNESRVLAETYSPYDFHIVLKHKDTDQTFELQDINVRQYPARYVEITKNPGGPGERAWWDFTGSQTVNNGQAWINASRDVFGGIGGIREGWFNGWTGGIFGITENPMMYIVNVTNLNPEDVETYPLHIGDPRTIYTSNDLWTPQEKTGTQGIIAEHYTYENLLPGSADDPNPASWSANAYGWLNHQSSESTRQLTDYYPTNETPLNEYRYMVSPRFRISSSYGNADASNSFGRVRARKRCASYQEYNYPAGRWRLPTPGELFFMVKLSQESVIPPLFSEDENYWTSHGLYRVRSKTITEQRSAEGVFSGRELSNGDNSTITGNYVIKGYTRCVYDEWYWNDKDGEPDIINFTLTNRSADFRWGDKKKNNPQEQQPEQ